jgi:hypothetical protein
MPALDRLQSALGGPDTTARHPAFQVVAVNLDTGASASAESEQAFLSQVGVTQLPLYRDPHLSLTRELKRRGLVFGLPTTILVDGRGCEIGTAEGGIAWDSTDAQSLITAAISGS